MCVSRPTSKVDGRDGDKRSCDPPSLHFLSCPEQLTSPSLMQHDRIGGPSRTALLSASNRLPVDHAGVENGFALPESCRSGGWPLTCGRRTSAAEGPLEFSAGAACV